MNAAPEQIVIEPQPGPQTAFAESSADIAIYGGSVFGGKTWGLLMLPLLHIADPSFRALIFRRTYSEVTGAGGMWDEASELYQPFISSIREGRYEYVFPSGAVVRFAHMQHEKDRFLHKGDQIGLIEFDQLETFTEKQFFYMLSRSRATRANIWPYIRATCNPVPEDDAVGGWLHTFVQWWIDAETGYAIPERSGVVRYMVRDGDRIEWGDSREELVERGYPAEDVLSVTFILATPYDNPIGLKRDPTYLTKVRSMARVDQERLLGDAKLGGNWNIRDTAGTLFSRDWFRYVDLAPAFVEAVRCWDRAATDEDSPNAARASRTAGALVGRDRDGVLYLRDMVCVQKDAHIVQQLLLDTARADGRSVEVAIFQDPGAAGKAEALATMRLLSREGFVVHILPTIPPRRTRDGNALEGPNAKVTYAKLWSPLVEKEQFRLVRGAWNREFVDEASNFDGTGLSDQVDAVSGAVHQLTSTARVFTF